MLLLGLAIAMPFALSGSRWYTDSLYYEAQKLEVMGASEESALDQVFAGRLARPLRGKLPSPGRLPEYAQFYRRRWTVPAIAAAVTPLFGDESLKCVSLLGWALLAPLLFLLLRRGFSPTASVAATVLALVLSPLLMWAPAPLVDSWGLTMLVAGLLLALLAKDDLRWLPVWVGVVLVGSFTRDVGVVLIPATAWMAVRWCSRRITLLAVTGFLASAPAPLLFSAPLQTNLAYLLNGASIPREAVDRGWLLAEYPQALLRAVLSDLTYPARVPPPYMVPACVILPAVLIGIWLLFRQPATPFLSLMRAAALAGLIPLLLSPNYTELRLELTLVPPIAAGLALLVETVRRRERTLPP